MTVTLDLTSLRPLGDDEFYELCRRNPDAKLERTARGELVVLMPTGGETGRRNSLLNYLLMRWAEEDGTGVVFDSSTLFKLPNGADRGPDAAWVAKARWQALSPEEREKFPPLCPDVVVELVSQTDSWTEQQAKLREYMANGARLGWLLDPYRRRVEIYRHGKEPELLEQPAALSGEDVLPGLSLDLTDVV